MPQAWKVETPLSRCVFIEQDEKALSSLLPQDFCCLSCFLPSQQCMALPPMQMCLGSITCRQPHTAQRKQGVQEPTSGGCSSRLCWWRPLVCRCLLEEGLLIMVCQEDGVQDELAQTGRQVLLLEQLHHWPVIKGILQAEQVD